MEEQPEYSGIFEKLEESGEMVAPDTPITRFYKTDIAENQYPNLDGPVSNEVHEFSDAVEAGEMVEEFAIAAGADLVGFSHVKDSFVFKGVHIDHQYSVAIGLEMDHELIQTAPDPPSGVEVLRAYWRLAEVAIKVASFIRSLGYPAKAHHPRSYAGYPPTILQTVAGLEAGFGEVGRLGVLITEEYGPRIRIATITTDLELPDGKRKEFGVKEFCSECHVCQEACQGDAIPETMEVVRGHMKYTIDPWKCLPEFAKYDGCNICVAKCVFNKSRDELPRFIESVKRNKQSANGKDAIC